MFETLLSLIAVQGTTSSADLARSLGVSHRLMDDMLEDLTRKRYLKVVAKGSAVVCERCPMHRACLHGRQARILMLSSKGERLLIRRGKDRAR